MNYSQKLRSPKWQKKRLEILNRDNFTCKLCSDTETELQVHHLEYKGNPWDVCSTKLVTLCKHCHAVVEHEIETFDGILRTDKVVSDNSEYCSIIVFRIDKTVTVYQYHYDALHFLIRFSENSNTIQKIYNHFNYGS